MMFHVRTKEEAKISVRALVKYVLDENPDSPFAVEKILTMLKEAYNHGRYDEQIEADDRYKNIV